VAIIQKPNMPNSVFDVSNIIHRDSAFEFPPVFCLASVDGGGLPEFEVSIQNSYLEVLISFVFEVIKQASDCFLICYNWTLSNLPSFIASIISSLFSSAIGLVITS
jgi:hypothetical protein